MWMDIAIGLIFVLSTASGFRKGFVRTFIHTAGWVLSIIIGFVFSRVKTSSGLIQTSTTTFTTKSRPDRAEDPLQYIPLQRICWDLQESSTQ